VNTAKSNTQSGSESSNAMPVLNQKQDEINALRRAFTGQRFTESFTDYSLGAVAYLQTTDTETVYMLGFSGKKSKPDFHYRFRSLEQAEKYRENWHQGLVSRARAKAERQAEKAAKRAQPHPLKVGDVLVSSWGYDQTNYDYYQVTRLVGKQSVEIRELGRQAAETGFLQGDCVPVKDFFKGEPMLKRVNENGSVKVHSWGVWASKKEAVKVAGVEIFKPDHYTAYA
jgi:hypothetical protein